MNTWKLNPANPDSDENGAVENRNYQSRGEAIQHNLETSPAVWVNRMTGAACKAKTNCALIAQFQTTPTNC